MRNVLITVLFTLFAVALTAPVANAQSANSGADAFVNNKDVNGGKPGCPFEDEVS